MARIVVTGAAGFIGANLVNRLADEGHQVRAVDIHHTELRRSLYSQADAFLRADLRDRANVAEAIEDCDEVFHLAADHGGAGYFYSDADWKAARNNAQIDLNVMAALQPDQKLFFASSACTYPTTIQGKGARALRESDWGGGPAEKQYGEAKRLSTILFEGARELGFDCRSGVFHTIYGPHQDYEGIRAKFPTAIVRKVLAAGNGPVEVWGDGTQVRTFLYIEDALDRILKVMREPYTGPVNVGSDEEVTVAECCEWTAEAAGVHPSWLYDLDAPTGVEHRSADNSEWNRRYGEGELTTAQEGFAKLTEWMMSLAPAAMAA